MAHLRLYLLGPPRLESDDAPVVINRRKAMALLCYLATSGGSHSRDKLATLLWPEADQRRARAGLRSALWDLNKTPLGTYLEVEAETIRLPAVASPPSTEPALWLDVARFQECLALSQTHNHPTGAICPTCLALLTEAASLYRDDFLAGFNLPDCPDYDEWQFFQTEGLRQGLATALERLIQLHQAQHELVAAIPHTRRWLALDPLHEAAHRQLMRLYAWTDQPGAALRQYEECVRLLQEELGVSPSAETKALYEDIKARRLSRPAGPPEAGEAQGGKEAGEQGSRGELKRSSLPVVPSQLQAPLKILGRYELLSELGRGGFAVAYRARDTGLDRVVALKVLRSRLMGDAACSEESGGAREPGSGGEVEEVSPLPPAPRHNLPGQTTPFIGREAELAALDAFIADPKVRLVTIVGQGGMGKTRLALAAAERQLDQPLFPEGIYFIELASLSTIEHIAPAVVEALNLPFSRENTPEQQVLNYLQEKRSLLLFDNFEHLSEGGGLISAILRVAPGVKILVTSRERLQLQEEQLYPLQGLAFPAGETEIAKEDVAAGYAAIALFLQSARRIRPDFELTADDLTPLIQTCHLSEGMPLGLELAASWIDVLPLADIAAELQQSLDFLETGIRNIPERHRSMRAVFDASWQRLSEAEQSIFSQLSVFRGGFTRAAAETVAAASIQRPVFLRLLSSLVSKSFLQYNQAQDRYQIHELLRQYAAEKLAEQTAEVSETSAVSEARDRHCAYYCTLLQQRNADLKGSRPQDALAEIELELDNIRTAWDWAVEQGQVERLDQAMDSLGLFYDWRVRYLEGETIYRLAVERLRERVSGEGLRVLSKLLTWQALFSYEVGQYEWCQQLEQQSLALLNDLELADQDIRQEKAFLFWVMGERTHYFDPEVAIQLYTQALTLCRGLGDRWGAAHALHGIAAMTSFLGAYDEAKPLIEESLAIRQELGDQRGVAKSLGNLADFFAGKGQFEEAEQLKRQVLAIYQEIDDQLRLLRAGHALAMTINMNGKFAESHLLLEENLLISSNLKDRRALAMVKNELGWALLHLGRYEQAAAYAQQSLTHFQESDVQWGVAWPLLTLGLAKLAQEAYVEAEQLLQESVSNAQRVKDLAFSGPASAGLGYVERSLGSQLQAQQRLPEILQLALEKGFMEPLWYTLPLIALLLADQGDQERAIELYALASRYPHIANSRWFEDVAGRHIAAVAATLPPEVVEPVQARGRARDLWETARELLAELEASAEGKGAEEQGSIGESEESPPPPNPPGPLHNLPTPATPFIGRERELAELAERLADPQVRLLTILGPGGMGKTRLALEAAASQVERYQHRVYFVPLAPLSSTEHIVPAIAEALNFTFYKGSSPEQQLLNYLQEKQMLLLLDNFEHLLEGTSLIADILQAAPQVKILATSRERLLLQEEHLYPLRGLDFADQASGEEAVLPDALKLFRQSARRLQPDFEVTAAELPHLNRICRLVEGMPLGLELAASWVDMLSLADIATEVQQSLDLLETEVRNIPARHRSIRAVFDASWQRLSEAEQAVLTQLSVFRGGFTRAAAQEVAGASLRTLATLANKSLLQYSKNRDRYGIHELLRQYAEEKLVDQSQTLRVSEVRNRHSSYYCAFLHRQEASLKSSGRQAALARIETDSENIRAAWQWAVEQEQVEQLGQAIDSLGLFYLWWGRLHEGEAACILAAEKLAVTIPTGDKTGVWTLELVDRARILVKLLTWRDLFGRHLGQIDLAYQQLQEALTLLDSPVLVSQQTRPERAHVLLQLGKLPNISGREEARQRCEQSLALYRTLNDPWGTAHGLTALGLLDIQAGAFDEAKPLFEECLALRQALNDPGVANTITMLGFILENQGQSSAAKQFVEQGLALFQEMGNPLGIAAASLHLSNILMHSGQYEDARDHCQMAQALYREIGGRSEMYGSSQVMLGELRLAEGAYLESRQITQESIITFQKVGALLFVGEPLIILGYVARALGDNNQAQQYMVGALGSIPYK